MPFLRSTFCQTIYRLSFDLEPADSHAIFMLWLQTVKAAFSFHKVIPKNTQMTTLYTNLSLYITFTMIYYIRQE